MAYGTAILMTLRTNQWTYDGEKSLDALRIVTAADFLDYGALRRRYERLGGDSPLFRVLPVSTTQMELAAMVEEGKADAFVVSGDAGKDGVEAEATSIRILQHFRKSAEIARGDVLLYVSAVDGEYAKRVIDAYEAGIRRIEASGERRRIFEYYGMVPEPVEK